jgi:predicted aconitase with swiveling domain
MMRIGTAPAAIVLSSADPILTVGAIVAESLYGVRCPIVVCGLDGLETGSRLRVTASDDSGEVTQRALRSGGR